MNERQILIEGCKQYNIDLTDQQVKQFFEYHRLLVEWNKKMNLTGITELKEVIIKHFIDSLAVCKGCDFYDGAVVIDVGTGAGFPGLPIKIAFPNIKLVLVDSLNKRINFLEEVVEQLGLEEVTCIHGRAEDLGHDETLREQADVCISRAVASLPVLMEYCIPFVKVGGQFISLKGPSISQEIENLDKVCSVLGVELSDIRDIVIPYSDLNHNLVIMNKVGEVPLKYPRKPSKIKKVPLNK